MRACVRACVRACEWSFAKHSYLLDEPVDRALASHVSDATRTGPDGRVFGSNQNKTAANTAGYAATVATVGDGEEADRLRDEGIPAGRWGRVHDIALAAV